jgi:uncharacterized membrane protein YdjX (TVP38/TMEM64 family)
MISDKLSCILENRQLHSMKRLLAIIAAIGFFILAIKYNAHLADMIAWVKLQGYLAPLFFILLYCISCLIAFPGLILTLAGGALFGPVWGTLINLIAATLGATCAFLLSRYYLSDWVERKSGRHLSRIITAIDNQGWLFVAFIRIVPLVPFNIVNFMLGVTNIRLMTYVLTTFAFMLPTEIAYTYAGFTGSKVILEGQKYVMHSIIIVCIIGLMALIPLMFTKLKKRL